MSTSNNLEENSFDKTKFYNTSLKLLNGRRHSIIAELPNLNEELTITDEVKNEHVEQTVSSIHNFVSHLGTVRKSFETISNNLEFLQLKNNLPSDIVQSIFELTYIYRKILSQKSEEDKNLFAAKLSHGKSKEIYETKLCNILNSSTYQKEQDPVFKRRLAAVAKMLKKLNAARIVKRNLISAFEFDPTNTKNMRSTCRRNLKLEDFL